MIKSQQQLNISDHFKKSKRFDCNEAMKAAQLPSTEQLLWLAQNHNYNSQKKKINKKSTNCSLKFSFGWNSLFWIFFLSTTHLVGLTTFFWWIWMKVTIKMPEKQTKQMSPKHFVAMALHQIAWLPCLLVNYF